MNKIWYLLLSIMYQMLYKHNIIHHNCRIVLVVTVVDLIVIVDDDVAIVDLILLMMLKYLTYTITIYI